MEDDWGLSFMVPGMIIGAAGFLIWFFMVPKPSWVGLEEESSVSKDIYFRDYLFFIIMVFVICLITVQIVLF